ncbi:MAG: hypothetical protein ACE5IL_11750 [Myxococcota bacterium]
MDLSPKAARRWLFALLWLTLPVPIYIGAVEWVPVARLWLLASLILGVVATEGANGFQGALAGLAAAEALLWPLVLYGISALCIWGLQRSVPARARIWVLGGLTASLLAISLFPIYQTPLSSHRIHSNLAGLVD